MLSAAFEYLCRETFGSIRGQSNRETNVDCPRCALVHNEGEGDKKGNLAINRHNYFFKCWKCDYKGSLSWLFKKHAPKELWEQFKDELEEPDRLSSLLNPHKTPEREIPPLEFPKEFISFESADLNDPQHLEPWNYLIHTRGVSYKQIMYYRLGFCLQGRFAGRIIFPSFAKDGQHNYFVSRTYREKVTPPYMNPDQDKGTIIFGEDRLNWDAPVFLTEGPFDYMVFPNSAMLMGKIPGPALLSKLCSLKPPVVIALDPDAWDDAQKLGALLENMQLSVRLLDLRPYGDRDPSKLFKDEGYGVFQHALKHNLKEVDFSNLDILL